MKKTPLVLLALLAAGLLAAVAVADHHPYKTTLTAKAVLDESDSVVIYSGRVGSPKPACFKSRRIVISKGSVRTRDFEVLGRTLTNAQGRWSSNQTRTASAASPTDITAKPKVVGNRKCAKATRHLTSMTTQP